MLIKSPVNILVISTDHYQKELYEEYRHGSNYDNFINNISRINSKRFFLNRENNLYTRASGVAVDKKMDLKEYNDFYSNYFDESGTVKMSERWDTYNNDVYHEDLRPCGLPFERLYIWYNGVTNPCDTDYKSYLSPGNVKEISLRKCWENLSNLRESMLNNKRQENIPCDRCYVAWWMHILFYGYGSHAKKIKSFCDEYFFSKELPNYSGIKRLLIKTDIKITNKQG